MNAIDSYMEEVDGMLKTTTDPFAQKYPELFKSSIEMVARDNWLKHGDPILSKEQMDNVYTSSKAQSGDKTWALVGHFNICMN